MRVLHTSDWHLGKTLEGRDRQEEQIQVLDEICQIVEDEKIDLVLIAGDIYQTVNPPAWAENLFYETLHRLSNFGKRAVVVISGNHDQPDRIKAANPLADKQGIYLIGLPTDKISPSLFKKDGQVYTVDADVGWLEITIPNVNHSTIVSVLPYPSEARLKQLFSESAEVKDIRKAYSSYINQWYQSQRKIFREDTVNLGMSHLFVSGGTTSDSEIEIQLGGAYTVEPKHIPNFLQYVALGHLHRAQYVKGTEALTKYAGSPLAYSFSEANHKKSVTVIDIEPKEEARVSEILLKSGKPLVQKKITNGMTALEQWLVNEGNTPAWIDLELHVEHPLSIEEIQRIRKMHDGFINIRVITPKHDRQNGSEMPKTKVPSALFEQFYTFKTGAAPRREVIDLFNELFQTQDEEGGVED